jgi:hypothetical protein
MMSQLVEMTGRLMTQRLFCLGAIRLKQSTIYNKTCHVPESTTTYEFSPLLIGLVQ